MKISNRTGWTEVRSLGVVPPGHFTPVGMTLDGSVYGNFVGVSSGDSRATRVDPDGRFQRLTEGMSLVEAVAADGSVVGCLGFGDESFAIVPGDGLRALGRSDPEIVLTCASEGGHFGGIRRTLEGSVGVSGSVDNFALVGQGAESVDVLSADGRIGGKCQTGHRYVAESGGEQFLESHCLSAGTWPVAFIPGGLVVNRLVNGSLEAVVCRVDGLEPISWTAGGAARALGVSSDGHVLLLGRLDDGRLGYGVWFGDEIDFLETRIGEWTMDCYCGFAPDGSLFGLARKERTDHVVCISRAVIASQAVIELSN